MCGIFFCLQRKNENCTFTIAELVDFFSKIKHRGPDYSCREVFDTSASFSNENDERIPVTVFLGFHRLAITGVSDDANTILSQDGVYLLCNGEIYNYVELIKRYNLTVRTDSDCEVILQFYRSFPERFTDFMAELDGDFAFVLYDYMENKIIASRDRMGVRPLFQLWTKGCVMFASEAKALPDHAEVYPFEPGTLIEYDCEIGLIEKQTWYIGSGKQFYHTDYNSSQLIIKQLLVSAVRKRLHADRPIGFLLSGGLDSSLVAAIAANMMSGPITTFSIGLPDSSDLKAAKQVATALGSIHHEVNITTDDVLAALPRVIYQNETFDITTTRASIPMYLLAKYIRENTDIKVIFSGEGSDELFGGYLYFHKAPDPCYFQDETHRLLNELYFFDVLRADRTTAAWGLELRVPFLDADLISFVSGIDPTHKMPKNINGKNMEKAILRNAFADSHYLPNEILYRQKEAFSDGVGYSSVRAIKEHADNVINFIPKIKEHSKRIIQATNEAKLYYHYWCDTFGNSTDLFPPHYWMPRWTNVTDPSATVLEMHNKNLANK